MEKGRWKRRKWSCVWRKWWPCCFMSAFNIDLCFISILGHLVHPTIPARIIRRKFFARYCVSRWHPLMKVQLWKWFSSFDSSSIVRLAACLAVSYVPGYFILPLTRICALNPQIHKPMLFVRTTTAATLIDRSQRRRKMIQKKDDSKLEMELQLS